MHARMSGNRTTGLSGEQVARDFFLAGKYRVLKMNYRAPCGEIDLILEKDDQIIFVEVKARRSRGYGLPQEAVGPAKQRKIIKTAMWYLQESGLSGREMRFDVLAVMFDRNGGQKITHIPWAFDATDYPGL